MDPISLVGIATAALSFVAAVSRVPRWSHRKTEAPAGKKERLVSDQLRGLKIVEPEPGESPEIDICFVHGVTGGAKSTWTAHDPKSGDEIFWPTELLARQSQVDKSFPRTRIMLYGYDTDVHSVCWLTARTLYHHADHLLADLSEARKGCKTRPLLFVAHSLGGLLVKSALIFGCDVGTSSLTDAREIYLSTIGIVSFGTPQTFAENPPLSKTITSLCTLPDALVSKHSASKPRYDDIDSDDWKHDIDILQRRLNPYKQIARKVPEIFCYESSTLRRSGFEPVAAQNMTVPPKRAIVHSHCKVVSINRDHLALAKFCTCDHDYNIITKSIAEFYKNRVQGRSSDRAVVEEPLPIPFRSVRDVGFVVLPQLPQRPKFVSRQSENSRQAYLEQVEKRLSTDRFAELRGRFGFGKTTLALEFAHQQMELENTDKRKPTSIFWISAESRPSLEASFMKIFRQLREKYGRDRYRTSDDADYSEMLNALSYKGWLDENRPPKRDEDLKVAIRAVLDWLSYPENKKWLLIYDDVENEGASCLEEFIPKDFLLPSKPTRGQIIMTSRDDSKRSSGADESEDQEGQSSMRSIAQRVGAASSTSIVVARGGYSSNTDTDEQSEVDFLERQGHESAFMGPDPWDSSNSEITKRPLRRHTDPILVGTFNREESKALIADLSRSASIDPESSPNRDEVFNNIAEKFADVPLDVFQAATFLSSTDDPEIAQNELTQGDGPFSDFPQEHARWFDTCVMLDRDSIPMLLVQLHFKMSEEQVRSSLETVQSLGWATIDLNSKSFKIADHRRRFRRKVLLARDQKRAYANEACNAITETVKYLSYKYDGNLSRSWCEQVLAKHVDECLNHLRDYQRSIGCEWDILAELCERQGLFERARDFYRAVKVEDYDDVEDTLSRTSWPHSTRQLDDVPFDDRLESQSSKSADVWNNPHEYAQSEPTSAIPKQSDTKSARALRSKLGLVRVQLQLHEFNDLDRRCQMIIQEVENRREKRYFKLWTDALELLVKVKVAQEEWSASIDISYDLIDVLEKEYGPTADASAGAIYGLAQIHMQQGDYGEAASLLEQILMIYEHTVGPSHPRTVGILNVLAGVYEEQGLMKKAFDSYNRVLDARRDQLGADHIETAMVQESLALVVDMMGNYQYADHMYKQAIHAAGLLGEGGEKNAQHDRMVEGYKMLLLARSPDRASPQ